MAADGYVTIHRTTDAAQGELLAETLRSDGIDARFHRVSSALIGVPTSMIEMTIDVPARSEARARELLRDLEYVGASDTAPEAGEAGDAAADAETADADGARGEARRFRRNPLLAPGFAFLLPGGAHLYARRPWTALVVALGLLSCFVGVVISHGALDLEIAFAIGIALVLCDAVGGLRAARAESRALTASRGRQLAAGFGLAGIAVALGAGAGLATMTPRMSRARQLAKYKVSCTGAAITVENRTGEARVLQVANLRIDAQSFAGDESYDIKTIGSGIVHVAAGGRAVVKPSIAGWLDRSCGFGFAPAPAQDGNAFGDAKTLELLEPRALSCRLSFDFFARDENAAERSGVEALGACVPPKGTAHESAGTLAPRR